MHANRAFSEAWSLYRSRNRVVAELIDQAMARARSERAFNLAGYLRGLAAVETDPELRTALLTMSTHCR
ncbi:MAG: hypothetical protein B7Z66_07255 [Chromatiales bacterium 21-64-14]|nr:MAG: hypothetical protein B7Z66_07255 [Chromatiales bacterium 21-64-14]HQU15468.1 hypothetical protein [Gammaproteobacteria bacterium]